MTVPIYQTSTYEQDAVGKDRGFEYSRTGNPTRAALEVALASLEGANYGRAFASGMAAEDAILRMLAPGDHLIMGNDAYGGTFRLISQVIAAAGVEWTAVDLRDTDAVAAAMRPETRLVWTETPTNPTLSVVDIAALAAVAHANDAWCVVDNTFATPYLQQPLAVGADIVVHSTTKYAGGHSDVVGGFVATNDPAIDERIGFFQNAVGAVPGPFDCYLLLRGLKTLAVRMDRHCDNAEVLAAWLEAHPGVASVQYPGAGVASRSRHRHQPDAPLRRHGVVRGRRRSRGRERTRRADRGVHPGRVARCGRVAHRGARRHDAPVGRRARRSPSIPRWFGCRWASNTSTI